jgi:hypothetical protein
VQIPLDVTLNTAPQKVLDILRALLHQFLRQDSVGIITHRKHVALILGQARSGPKPDEAVRQRLAMVEHFRGGQSGGSNDRSESATCLLSSARPACQRRPSAIN